MIYELFLQTSTRHPNTTAIVTSEGHAKTYSEVHEYINQWTNFYLNCNLTYNQRVGVLTNADDSHIFAYLALDSIQATYVPLDVDTPSGQLLQAFNALNLDLLIIDKSLSDKFVIPSKLNVQYTESVLDIVRELPKTATRTLATDNSHKHISYVMSSSGSTGEKKWIPIYGAGLLYWADVERQLLNLNDKDSILCTRSPAYDARISEYVRSFASGSCLYLLSSAERKDIQCIIKKCKQFKVNCILLIGSQLDCLDLSTTFVELKEAGLKHLIVTGEACSHKLKTICEMHNIKLWNAYGPTEATFGLSMLCVNNIPLIQHDGKAIVPIGQPIGQEVKCHLLDGRLFIESPFLSPGYLNASNETNFQIISINGTMTRVFDTGDRFAKQDDYLVYQGRHSDEVHCKVSGVKVSPFMIERAINSYNDNFAEEVVHATVVVKEWQDRDKPFAYITMKQSLDKQEFATYLKSQLKAQEIPIIIQLDSLPRLIPSQKIDKQALIARQDSSDDFFFGGSSRQEADLSDDDILQTLCGIWSTVLERVKIIDLDDEFQFLGGNSILAASLVKHIQEELDSDYSYGDLLKLPIINLRHLAMSINKRNPIRHDYAIANTLVFDDENKENFFFLPPLLGEGYFTYKNLAKVISKKFNTNIYGLSDPAIFDAAMLPTSLKSAAKRYIKSIKKIQPQGPYRLLGYSYGATLVTEVASLMTQQNDSISQIILLDGFPPLLYQQLTPRAHSILLKSLINFVIGTFHNSFYKETISNKIENIDLGAMPITEQVDVAFSLVEQQLQNSASKRVLQLARTHLDFMLKSRPHNNKIATCANFYHTARSQEYLSIIDTLSISKHSSDYNFYFWTYYYSKVRLSGFELENSHIGILQSRFSKPNAHPVNFWRSTHDIVFSKNIDYGLEPLYTLDKVANVYQLTICPLTQARADTICHALQQLNLSHNTMHLDRSSALTQNDQINYSLLAVYCQLHPTQLSEIKKMMETQKIKYKNSAVAHNETVNQCDTKTISVALNLNTFWNGRPLQSFSLPKQTYSQQFIARLAAELKMTFEPESDINSFLYFKKHFILVQKDIFVASAMANELLMQFIALACFYRISPKESKKTLASNVSFSEKYYNLFHIKHFNSPVLPLTLEPYHSNHNQCHN